MKTAVNLLFYAENLLCTSVFSVVILITSAIPSRAAENGEEKPDKIQNCVVKVYTKDKIGKIKKLNGGNLAPPISPRGITQSLNKTFPELNIPITRLHDAPWESSGASRLVDIPLIFANFHADANDPRNYYFVQTDDYIKNCIDLGTEIYYRLGVSIEHSSNKYFVHPPENVDKWIEICSNVIRHYTEGWADGFHYDIKYWEIWNEPDLGKSTWTGTIEEFNAFYVKAAKELKKRFPHLKIGGPAHVAWRDTSKDFIAFCAKNKAPMDFYSYHTYTADPYGGIIKTPAKVRKALDEAGYTNTEIHLNEWHYFHGDWKRLRSDFEYSQRIRNEIKDLDSAGFLCTVMSLWQDTPLDMGFYYTVTTSGWGLYTTRTDIPTKSYYGMKAFGEIVRYPDRIKTESSNKRITVLAGTNKADQTAVLISCFKSGAVKLKIETDVSMDSCEVFAVDDKHNLEKIDATCRNNTIETECPSSSSVLLIKFGN